MTEDATHPHDVQETAEPEWLEDLREDLRRASEREVKPPPRRTTLLDRLLG